MFKRLNISLDLDHLWLQFEPTTIEAYPRNIEGNIVSDISMYVKIGNFMKDFVFYGDKYVCEVDPSQFALGPYKVAIITYGENYEDIRIEADIVVVGNLTIISATPSVEIEQTNSSSISIYVVDEFYHVVPCTINASLDDQQNIRYSGSPPTFVINITANISIGLHNLNITATSQYAIEPASIRIPIRVFGYPKWRIYGPGINSSIIQGNVSQVALELYDILGNPVNGADIELSVFGFTFTMSSQNNSGRYYALIPTEGFSSGNHTYTLVIRHEYLETVTVSGVLNVLGVPKVTINIFEKNPMQHRYLEVEAIVTDLYGYPLENISVYVEIGNIRTMMDRVDPITYKTKVYLDLRHGEYEVKITVEGASCVEWVAKKIIYVLAEPPTISLSEANLLFALVVSISLILIISFFYVRYVSVTRNFMDTWTRTIRLLGIYYLMTIIVFGISLMCTWYSMGSNPSLTLAISTATFLLVILLAMIWLLRDLYVILMTGRFRFTTLLVTIFHFVLVILPIYVMIQIGVNIEWFQAYILEDTTNLAGYTIPNLAVSIMSAFIGSFIILIPHSYIKVRSFRRKLEEMQKAGASKEILTQEVEFSRKEIANSVRNKSLAFIILVGFSVGSYLTFMIKYVGILIIFALPIIALIIIVLLVPPMIKRLRGREYV